MAAATPADLDTALAAAKPGDTIQLRDGAWGGCPHSAAAGTATAPITIRAETPGEVIFSGSSRLTFTAPHVAVTGIRFQDGAIAKGSVIAFRSNHCRLTDIAIVNYNPQDVLTSYYWVYFEGNDNVVERSLFAGNNHMGPLVGNAIKDARHNVVRQCHFKDIASSQGRNGMEIFRFWGYGGNEELGDDGASFTIESNLFEHADGESMEIVSLGERRQQHHPCHPRRHHQSERQVQHHRGQHHPVRRP